MTEEVYNLKVRAESARYAYNRGFITRAEAQKEVQPYIDLVNKKAVEIAKKYSMRPQKIQMAQFFR